MEFVATLQYKAIRSSLVNLPEDAVQVLLNSDTPAQGAIVEVEARRGSRDTQMAVMGFSGLAAKKPGVLEIDPTFAQALGFLHGAKVTVRLKTQAPEAMTVWLEPITPADWLIVESHASFLEAHMINQVRMVAPGQPITVFPSPSAIASLVVTSVEPRLSNSQKYARLGPVSEVIIAPKEGKLPKEEVPSEPVSAERVADVLIRTTAFPQSDLDIRELELHGPNILAEGPVLVSVVEPGLIVDLIKDEVDAALAVVATYRHGSPRLSAGLSAALQVWGQVGTQVLVKPNVRAAEDGVVTVRPLTSQTGTLKIGKDVDWAKIIGLDVITSNQIIPPTIETPQGAILQTGCDLTAPSRWELGAELAVAESRLSRIGASALPNETLPVVGRETVTRDLLDFLNYGRSALIVGSRGCGKSVIVHEIGNLLKASGTCVVNFACGNFGDKPLPAIRDALHKAVANAVWHAPSVILFDDLDRLVVAELEHGDSTRSRQIAELFASELRSVSSGRNLSVLATAQNRSNINSVVANGHIFDEMITLKSPDKELRESILGATLAHLGLKGSSLDYAELAAITEGYQPGDLWTLTERVASSLALDGTTEATTDDFERAAASYTPASLRGVKLEKSSTKWQDVGGLTAVKRVLLETLEWPTKYAPIFAASPLRLRSGLLLYGYPGCGKTFVASAVAGATGLNFISVKGPEILNKYIGASEQSVRDLFDRAQAAKPCVLFFDEFDSIAPKRGHDSTGVTDRVVNQLLTQMDGAEGLSGVYVLAATSRPDLIDSALLRPGRLDKSLLCDIPSFSDRLEILNMAQAKMNLAPDVTLHEVALKTEGFTPADLQALMYNAYLDSIHAVLDDVTPYEAHETSTDLAGFQVGPMNADVETAKHYMQPSTSASTGLSGVGSATGSVLVTMKNIEAAVLSAKPSISKKELNKLGRIYQQFVSDRDGNLPPGDASNEIGGRVTLG